MSRKLFIGVVLLLVIIFNFAIAEYFNRDLIIYNFVTDEVTDYISPEKEINTQLNIATSTYLVSHVIDGDTIDVEVNGEVKRVRYIGIDTPERANSEKTAECFAEEATTRNRELVEGKFVTLIKDVSEVDKYGRLLRYVYVEEEFVNLSLVSDGYATTFTLPPDVAKAEVFRQNERKAKEMKRGLWGEICK